ncbi:MBL fold metallo-hydrolase [Acidisoma cellulosilytica]|uniref:MBL fold metallo-hydrolase n=1 Tax=Acidisoma cellulosilyticum TaxID=2802395 RepID=A0A963Z363_9PROT|nr:MBL fold metallo-hydrolase [Acidisoma cellulosilyticum]MCB8881935.1 MBL fold metallo-hydrolase [Acidisoma cellulosilyticum]
MRVRCDAQPFTGPLAARVQKPAEGVSLYWLGQAGFLIRGGGLTLLIDPYLSDSLAEKYRGKPFPHQRMMLTPIAVADLPPIDLVLCTHAHTDHMDPRTLQPLLALQPQTRVISPRAKLTEAMTRASVDADRVVTMDAGETISPLPGLTIRAVRAAHETVERDAEGCHVFLGYAMTLGGCTVFHAGDTIPFDGQVDEVRALGADIALLPVNGRSAALAAQRVPGNFFLAEAIALTAQAGIPTMIAHHFDMFDFNTLPRADIEAAAAQPDLPINLLPAAPGVAYRLA